MARLALTALIGLSLNLPIQARPETVPNGWRTLKPGLQYREVHRTALPGDTIYELRCDPKRTRLHLLAASDYGWKKARVDELTRKARCWGAVNGGYFGTKDEPLGYQRDFGRVLSPDLASGGAFGGVFVIGPNGPELKARDSFHPGTYTFALQCGPRLIVQGHPVKGIHAEERRRRTGIGYDRQGWVFLYATGVTGRYTLAECQQWLAGPRIRGGMDPVGVLNLDGGSSTQFYLRTPQVTVDVPGLTSVAVGIGISPR
jgi:uncharacterized protein YigE (DUF2233 family)